MSDRTGSSRCASFFDPATYATTYTLPCSRRLYSRARSSVHASRLAAQNQYTVTLPAMSDRVGAPPSQVFTAGATHGIPTVGASAAALAATRTRRRGHSPIPQRFVIAGILAPNVPGARPNP